MFKSKKALPKKIIILRFSSMGDVAIVASLLQEFSAQNPDTELIMVSRKLFKPFFVDVPNLQVHPILTQTTHKGFKGLYRLYKELKAYQPDAVADLHENIRSRVVSLFFRLHGGVAIKRIDKGRAEKKALTRIKNKILKPLKTSIQRYSQVFEQLGFHTTLSNTLKKQKKQLPEDLQITFAESKINIGISPFAQYAYKMYPLEKMQAVLHLLCNKGYRLFIFGGGVQEQNIAKQWAAQSSEIYNLIGIYSLAEELKIISNLDLMISMDSSGMHMASLMGVPVVSVWGPTHPFAGFLGYGQSMESCVQVAHPARPNSVYGNKPCLCDGVPSMELISPQMIQDKVVESLQASQK